MKSVFLFEIKYYFKNLKEVIQLIGLFSSIVLLYPFSQVGGFTEYQHLAASMLWIALTAVISLGGTTLFQRDQDSGQLEYYQLANAHLTGVILAKWVAYYVMITIPLALVLPVAALLVDIPVDAWFHYGLGLASGAMALSILVSLISVVMTGLGKAGAALSLVALPLTIPVIIFGTGYLADTAHDLQSGVFFLWGFSFLMLPVLCLAGASCIRAAN